MPASSTAQHVSCHSSPYTVLHPTFTVHHPVCHSPPSTSYCLQSSFIAQHPACSPSLHIVLLSIPFCIILHISLRIVHLPPLRSILLAILLCALSCLPSFLVHRPACPPSLGSVLNIHLYCTSSCLPSSPLRHNYFVGNQKSPRRLLMLRGCPWTPALIGPSSWTEIPSRRQAV